MSEDSFEDAERAAEVLLHANAAVWGDEVSETSVSERDNWIVALRINGPEKARQCGHLAGPALVHLHSAIKVHQCEQCATSERTRATLDDHLPERCDSCGQVEEGYWPAQFRVQNILVSAYICDECREGRRPAKLPEWLGNEKP